MSKKKELKVPSANEFSPGVVELKRVLEVVEQYKGNRDNIIDGLRNEYFFDHAKKHKSDPKRRLKEQQKLANNICIGISSYGLYDIKEAELTGSGTQLLGIKKESDLHEEFAKYILRDLGGIELLSVIRDMKKRRDVVNKKSLAHELNRSGFTTAQGKKIPLNTTDHTKLLGWLRKVGILPKKGYEIDEEKFKKLAGISGDVIDELNSLTLEQRCFLRTMRRLTEAHGDAHLFAKDVMKNCEIQHGQIFNPIADQLSKLLYKPLEEKGWIKLSGRGKGRGGSSGRVAATKKLIILDPLHLSLGEFHNIPPDLRDKLNKPLDLIYEELKSDNTFIKGIALEILAYRISSEIGLELLKFRERSAATNGAEVDLICEGVHLHYSRWLVQCKNTKQVTVAALAKEVGMAVLLNANVILLVTTGKFSKTVVEHARGLAEKTPFQAVLIDKDVLKEYKEKGISSLLVFFHETARETMVLKRKQIEDIEEREDA